MSAVKASEDIADPQYLYKQYEGEKDIESVISMVEPELSEPYSIFTYRYFLSGWPQLCFLVYNNEMPIGTVVCKKDKHGVVQRGYIAMLVVNNDFRGHGIGSKLVKLASQAMKAEGCHEIVLEADVNNMAGIRLYLKMGFVIDKRLVRYYMSGQDAFRLKQRIQSYNLQELQEQEQGNETNPIETKLTEMVEQIKV